MSKKSNSTPTHRSPSRFPFSALRPVSTLLISSALLLSSVLSPSGALSRSSALSPSSALSTSSALSPSSALSLSSARSPSSARVPRPALRPLGAGFDSSARPPFCILTDLPRSCLRPGGFPSRTAFLRFVISGSAPDGSVMSTTSQEGPSLPAPLFPKNSRILRRLDLLFRYSRSPISPDIGSGSDCHNLSNIRARRRSSLGVYAQQRKD